MTHTRIQFSDINMQLFPGLSPERLSTFTCGHVIPKSNLQCVVIGKGPSGGEFQFTYKDRGNEALVSCDIKFSNWGYDPSI